MNDLVKNINDNYNMNIENIQKLGITTINDIFIINSSCKKYIVKIYNIDEEEQIKNSLDTQKKLYESIEMVADVLVNKENEMESMPIDDIENQLLILYEIEEKIRNKQEYDSNRQNNYFLKLTKELEKYSNK